MGMIVSGGSAGWMVTLSIQNTLMKFLSIAPNEVCHPLAVGLGDGVERGPKRLAPFDSSRKIEVKHQ